MKFFFSRGTLLLVLLVPPRVHSLLAETGPAGEPASPSGRPGILAGVQAEPEEEAFRLPFVWSLLWSGVWEDKKNLTQRGDLRLRLPGPGLSLRLEILDREPAEFRWPWEHPSVFARSFDGSGAAVQGGLYHDPTGTRLLYGLLDEWGLPARLQNTWQRSVPFAENWKPSTADLKTAPVSSGDPEFYLYLGSPRLNLPLGGIERAGENAAESTAGDGDGAAGLASLRGFGSARFDQSGRSSFGGGLEGCFGGKVNVSLEGFRTGWNIPARKGSAWFSETLPLPERDFSLYGLGFLAESGLFALSSDWGWSETFAWGRDLYGALGLRIGRAGAAALKGWQLSLAADGAGSRFTGSDGSGPGPGFRTGAKIQWQGRGGRLFRANTTLRSSGLEEPFNRVSLGLYYRFAPGKGAFSISRVSLSADRDREDPERPLDGAGGVLGFGIRPRAFPSWFFEFLAGKAPAGKDVRDSFAGFWFSPLNFQVSASLNGIPADASAPDYSLYSAKAGGNLSWSPSFFRFRLGLAYQEQSGQEGLWDFSFSAGVHGKPGRLSIRIDSEDFPDTWAYTLSWRLEKK